MRMRHHPRMPIDSSDIPRDATGRPVDPFQRDWRRRLETACHWVDYFGNPLDLVNAMPAARLLAVDEKLRVPMYESRAYGTQAYATLQRFDRTPVETEPFLFVIGCDPIGQLRQQALRVFREHPGPLATALALIRAHDWVAQVRAEAMGLLRNLLARRGGADLFAVFDLVIALQQRQRVDADLWAVVMPALRDPSLAAARWAATRRGSTASRLFAYALLAEIDADGLEAARREAIVDANPAIARWALSGDDVPMPVVLAGMSHPHASVRAQSLRAWVARAPEQAHGILLGALDDRSAAVRGVAAYWGKRLFGIDPVAHWRASLDADDESAPVALAALASLATADDAGRLRPWLAHARPALRALALRGYARTEPDDLPGTLCAALVDPSPRVARQALDLAARHPGVLNLDGLRDAIATATDASTLRRLRHASIHLGPWDRLELLLEWLGDERIDGATRAELHPLLRVGANGGFGFAKLAPARRDAMLAVFRRIRTQLPEWTARDVEHTLTHA
jgi:hypothetical protein